MTGLGASSTYYLKAVGCVWKGQRRGKLRKGVERAITERLDADRSGAKDPACC